MSVITKEYIEALKNNPAISELEAIEIVDELHKKEERLAAVGKPTRGEADLMEAVKADFKEAEMVLANQRRQTAITNLRLKEINSYLTQLRDLGFSVLDGIESLTVGSTRRIPGARTCVDAIRSGIEAEYLGRFVSGIEAIAEKRDFTPNGLVRLMTLDPDFARSFARERMSPGSEGDALVKDAVELYDSLSEDMRVRLNKAGADIGKLEGWLPQGEDQLKLLDRKLGGRDGWVDFTHGLLDAERSFPRKTPEEVRENLGDVYDTIVTGRDLWHPAGEPLAAITPRNIASGRARHRVLYFRDGDAFMAYRERYGRGSIFDAIFAEFSMNARKLGLMEVLGPAPESMVRSLLDAEKQRIRADVELGAIDAGKAKNQLRAMNKAFTDGAKPTGKVARWLSILSGETMLPADVGLAKASGIARSFQSFSKLGAAALSTVAGSFTKAAALRVNGVGYLEKTSAPILDYLKTYQGDTKVLAREMGFLFRDMHGSMLQRFNMADGAPGHTSAAINTFFKWTGMNFASGQRKAGFAMRISNHLGMARKADFMALNPDLRAMLQYHGFDARDWGLMRRHMIEGAGEDRYLNPALARNLSDAHIAHLLPERLQEDTPGKEYTAETWAHARQLELDRLRTDIETRARAFFADERKFSVIEPDAKTTETMTGGTRSVSPEGEALRALMQFRNFPVAFQHVATGGKGRRHDSATGYAVPGIIEYAASSLAYGYLAMTLKDYSTNRSPRNPGKVKTWFAAAVQSGALGMYGDFLFGKASRFAGDSPDPLAGPLPEKIGEEESPAQHDDLEKTRDQSIRLNLNTTPCINLRYTRAAMDWLLVDTIKEYLSPGYKQRMRKNMNEQYGQEHL